ncbi:hypothetical protein YIM730264_19130 [Thermus hydrothermalis]
MAEAKAEAVKGQTAIGQSPKGNQKGRRKAEPFRQHRQGPKDPKGEEKVQRVPPHPVPEYTNPL